MAAVSTKSATSPAVRQSIEKYLPNVLVSLVNEYYMRGEADVIAALESTPGIDLKAYHQFRTEADTSHELAISETETLEYDYVDPFESFDNIKWAETAKSPVSNDRWIFECSETGTFTRFLGVESGVPCGPWTEYCRIIVALENDYMSGCYAPPGC